MNYEQFKKDSECMKLTDFMNKWGDNLNYKKYETRLLKGDLYEYLSDNQYDDDDYNNIEEMLIIKNTYELYMKCIYEN